MLLGIVKAIWDGTSVPLKPGSTFSLGGVVSKPQMVGTTVDYSNSMEASEIVLNVAVGTGFNVTGTFPSGVRKELQIQCDSGQTFIWENAFRSGVIPITSGDNSEAKVTIAAGAPIEQVQQ